MKLLRSTATLRNRNKLLKMNSRKGTPLKDESSSSSRCKNFDRSKSSFKYQKVKAKARHLKLGIIFGIWGVVLTYLTFNPGNVKSSPLGQLEVDSEDVHVARPSVFSPEQYYSYGRLMLKLGAGANGSDPSSSWIDDEYSYWEPGFNCTPPAILDFPPDIFTQDERRSGGIIVHFIVSAYVFYTLALVCDDFFVPSIESISDALHLPADVAGATFMAIATSAPELFTNVIGTFITEGDIGVGTIVGSAVFNILAICACCGLAARETLQLEWWPLTRDCFFYSLSVILLIIVLGNRQVFWWEALVLVLCYCIYITVMYYNTKCKHFAEGLVYGILGKSVPSHHYYHHSEHSKTIVEPEPQNEKTPLISHNNSNQNEDFNGNGDAGDDLESSAEYRDELLIAKALAQAELDAAEEEREWGLWSPPHGNGWVIWSEWILGWPARFFLTFTIPDCREHRFRKWYPFTFTMCIVWIASLSYIVSWMMTVIGHTLKIPDSVMGLTFLAAGTSVPEAVSSIIVSRQGLGAMGISNSIGSNTFDILICLGVPWLVKSALIANNPTDNFIQINSSGLEYSTILLISSVIALYAIIACNNFLLSKRVAIVALCMYLGFVIISCLFELNVFFIVNLPTCPILE